jgi:hypothetical protein
MCEREFEFPQGQKPNVYGAWSGTAEGVPFQIAFMRPLGSVDILGSATKWRAQEEVADQREFSFV